MSKMSRERSRARKKKRDARPAQVLAETRLSQDAAKAVAVKADGLTTKQRRALQQEQRTAQEAQFWEDVNRSAVSRSQYESRIGMPRRRAARGRPDRSWDW